MNVKLTTEELAFRDEMREFFTTQVPPRFGQGSPTATS